MVFDGRLCCALAAFLLPLLLPVRAEPVVLGSQAFLHHEVPPAGAAGDFDPVFYDAVIAGEREAIVSGTAGRLSRYRIDARLDLGAAGRAGAVAGTLDLRFVNGSATALSELYFRLYPNDPSYADGALVVTDVVVAGASVTGELSVEGTVLGVPLPAPLPEGAATDVRLGFRTTVPIRPLEGYGIFAGHPSSGTWTLAHWFPILAGHDANGWSLDPVSRYGDPIFSTTALFDVSLTAPGDLVVVTSGRAVAEDDLGDLGDRVRRRYVTGPARDFTIVADDDFESVIRQVGGTTVTSYFNPANATGGAEVLAHGARALETFNALFGTYPYREMDLVEVELRAAAGVEFPQLMLIGNDLYEGDLGDNPHYLELVTAHEVTHQWWYGLVGNNQHLDAFIDEGLAEYAATAVYFGARYDGQRALDQFDREVKLWYLRALFTVGDQIVDQPTDDFPSAVSYGATVYAKAALGFDAIRAEIGDEAFFAGLRDYVRRERFGVATPADLRAALARASNRDIDDLWRHWFESAEGTEDFTVRDYLELQAAVGAG